MNEKKNNKNKEILEQPDWMRVKMIDGQLHIIILKDRLQKFMDSLLGPGQYKIDDKISD